MFFDSFKRCFGECLRGKCLTEKSLDLSTKPQDLRPRHGLELLAIRCTKWIQVDLQKGAELKRIYRDLKRVYIETMAFASPSSGDLRFTERFQNFLCNMSFWAVAREGNKNWSYAAEESCVSWIPLQETDDTKSRCDVLGLS